MKKLLTTKNIVVVQPFSVEEGDERNCIINLSKFPQTEAMTMLKELEFAKLKWNGSVFKKDEFLDKMGEEWFKLG